MFTSQLENFSLMSETFLPRKARLILLSLFRAYFLLNVESRKTFSDFFYSIKQKLGVKQNLKKLSLSWLSWKCVSNYNNDLQ